MCGIGQLVLSLFGIFFMGSTPYEYLVKIWINKQIIVKYAPIAYDVPHSLYPFLWLIRCVHFLSMCLMMLHHKRALEVAFEPQEIDA
jgi:hypothetical protein